MPRFPFEVASTAASIVAVFLYLVVAVVANVAAFLQGQPFKKAYKGSPEMILIPLGKVRSLRLCLCHCVMQRAEYPLSLARI